MINREMKLLEETLRAKKQILETFWIYYIFFNLATLIFMLYFL